MGQRRRNEKSLANTFPFNSRSPGSSGAHDHEHHEHAHDHSPVSDVAPIRDARQGAGKGDIALDIVSIAAAGERCIDKVSTWNLLNAMIIFKRYLKNFILIGCDG